MPRGTRPSPATAAASLPPPVSTPYDEVDAILAALSTLAPRLQDAVSALRVREQSLLQAHEAEVQQLGAQAAAKDARIAQLEDLVAEANARDTRSRAIHAEFERRLMDEQQRWQERLLGGSGAAVTSVAGEVIVTPMKGGLPPSKTRSSPGTREQQRKGPRHGDRNEGAVTLGALPTDALLPVSPPPEASPAPLPPRNSKPMPKAAPFRDTTLMPAASPRMGARFHPAAGVGVKPSPHATHGTESPATSTPRSTSSKNAPSSQAFRTTPPPIDASMLLLDSAPRPQPSSSASALETPGRSVPARTPPATARGPNQGRSDPLVYRQLDPKLSGDNVVTPSSAPPMPSGSGSTRVLGNSKLATPSVT